MIEEDNKILDGRFVLGSLICWLAVFWGSDLYYCVYLKTKVGLFYEIAGITRWGNIQIAIVLEIIKRGGSCARKDPRSVADL